MKFLIGAVGFIFGWTAFRKAKCSVVEQPRLADRADFGPDSSESAALGRVSDPSGQRLVKNRFAFSAWPNPQPKPATWQEELAERFIPLAGPPCDHTEHFKLVNVGPPDDTSHFYRFLIEEPGGYTFQHQGLDRTCAFSLLRGLERAYRAGAKEAGEWSWIDFLRKRFQASPVSDTSAADEYHRVAEYRNSTQPHAFDMGGKSSGIPDGSCVKCGLPDRNPIHTHNQYPSDTPARSPVSDTSAGTGEYHPTFSQSDADFLHTVIAHSQAMRQPHVFDMGEGNGIPDRPCLKCGLPERYPIHTITSRPDSPASNTAEVAAELHFSLHFSPSELAEVQQYFSFAWEHTSYRANLVALRKALGLTDLILLPVDSWLKVTSAVFALEEDSKQPLGSETPTPATDQQKSGPTQSPGTAQGCSNHTDLCSESWTGL